MLGRDAPAPARVLMRAVLPVFNLLGRFRSQFSVGTPDRAGSVLAELASGAVAPPAGHGYASLVRGELTFPNPSELARNDEARDRLWRESATMVGLPA